MLSVEIKIPNRLVGLGKFMIYYLVFHDYIYIFIFLCMSVIGRQGEMINKLQAESAARIQVAPGQYNCFYPHSSKKVYNVICCIVCYNIY